MWKTTYLCEFMCLIDESDI